MTAYQGGKHTLGKKLAKIISMVEIDIGLSHLPYVEPFCGMCGVLKNISKMYPSRVTYAYDLNFDVIEMWKSLQKGWKPPVECDRIQFEQLKKDRHIPSAERGFLGTVACYSNIFMSYYREPVCGGRDYIGEASRSLMKVYTDVKDCTFSTNSYENVDVEGKVVYCDPPYMGNGFKTNFFQNFDHEKFWGVMRTWSEHCLVFISEATCPPDFKSIWSQNINVSINRKKRTTTNENLFVHISWYEKIGKNVLTTIHAQDIC